MKEQTLGGAICNSLFLLLGLILLIWPERVRDRDAKMTLIVKDPSTYKLLARAVGAFFILCSVLIILVLSTSD